MPAALRSRLGPAALLLGAVAAGLAVRFLPGVPPLLAKVAGVALWSVAAYACVLLARPRARVLSASLIALGLSFGIELAQLTPYPAALSARHLLLRLLLGTTFSAWDLPAYAAGVLGAALLHHALLRPAEP